MIIDQFQQIKEQAEQIYQSLTEKEKQLFHCDKCVLYDGSVESRIVTIARDLGKDEIEKGVPLIGAAGSIFRFVEAAFEYPTFKINTVPFRPTDNIVFPLEIRKKFKNIIDSIIEVVNPRAIIVMGNEALETFVYPRYRGITQYANDDGFEMLYKGRKLQIFPVVHPSYLIRQGINFKSLKDNKEHNKIFKELFFKNIYRAYKFVEENKENG